MSQIEDEEYNVYSDFFKQKFSLSEFSSNIPPLIIQGKTTIRVVRYFDSDDEFDKAVRDRNSQPYKLENKFSLNKVDVILLSDEELEETFDNHIDPWAELCKKYGHSSLIELSRVTFLGEGKIASLYYSIQSDYLMGCGCKVLLVKEQENWKMLPEIEVWVS